MANVDIKSILICLVVVFGLEEVLRTIGIPLYSGALSYDAIVALIHNESYLRYVLGAIVASAFVGGYVCARMVKIAPYKNILIMGVVTIVIGLFDLGRYPLWFYLGTALVIIPASVLGGFCHRVTRRN